MTSRADGVAPLPLVALVGPTGVGKSALAVRLASRFQGELINADSRQVYRFMDIGTAKPSSDVRASVPHHLYDAVDPAENFTLARFLELARQVIREVAGRGRLPIVVGGTGQYIRALLEGWQTPRVPPDRQFREELYEEVAQAGPEVLYAKLKRVDPVAATSIDPHNVRRIVRALEVSEITGRPFSEARGKEPSPYRSLVIGLTTATRQEMYDLADARVDGMLEQGWLQEVQRLVGMGYKPGLPSLSSLGYRELALYLQGELPLEEAVRRIKAAHHRLIRHQFTWFKQTDPRIHWLRIGEGCEDRAVALIQELLENSATTPSQGR